MAKGGHSVSKIFRFTPEEAKLLSVKSNEAGMTESAYIRLLISQKPKDYQDIRILLKELINEINHIGININQIVKNYNSGFYSDADKERLFAYMKKLNKKVDEAVMTLGSK